MLHASLPACNQTCRTLISFVFPNTPVYIQQIWGRLTRQLKPDVSQNTQLYTMLPVPNPFVVPGARFREV